MKVIVCDNYDEMSKKAAELLKEQLDTKPDSVLGFATGSTPVGTYKCLIDMYQKKEIDFSKVTSFNLDEYYPIKQDNPQSYHYFMNENLFNYINLDKSKIHIPNGDTEMPQEECIAYDRAVSEAGGVDLQILGIGRNGHIGFNEPDETLVVHTHVTSLTKNTIEANSRFFKEDEVIPTEAITMGMSTILSARKILLLANGRAKHDAVRELLSDGITTSNPSTMLKLHPDVTLICDRAAYADMQIGIDIGGMSVKVGVVDENKIIDRKSIPVDENTDALTLTELIADVCREFSEEYPITSIGVGTPGYIKNGCVTAVNLPFKDYPLADELSARLNVPVALGNDADCAAFGEALAGAGKDVENMVLITIGTGIGSGIIIDNKIYSGAGSAGEAGHICIEQNGLQCNCGRKGCWEQYASAAALIRNAKKAASENPDSVLASFEEITAKSVFEAMDKGCEVAKKVFDKYLDYLASGLTDIINLLDPELILISGGISNANGKLLNPLLKKLPDSANVAIAVLKNDAGIIGAAAL